MVTVTHVKADTQLCSSAFSCKSPPLSDKREKATVAVLTGDFTDSQPCESPHYFPCILCHWQTCHQQHCCPRERGLKSVDSSALPLTFPLSSVMWSSSNILSMTRFLHYLALVCCIVPYAVFPQT
jgi:hypothetical protein